MEDDRCSCAAVELWNSRLFNLNLFSLVSVKFDWRERERVRVSQTSGSSRSTVHTTPQFTVSDYTDQRERKYLITNYTF